MLGEERGGGRDGDIQWYSDSHPISLSPAQHLLLPFYSYISELVKHVGSEKKKKKEANHSNPQIQLCKLDFYNSILK